VECSPNATSKFHKAVYRDTIQMRS